MSQQFDAYMAGDTLVEQWVGPTGRILRRVESALTLFNDQGECAGVPVDLQDGLAHIGWKFGEAQKLGVAKVIGK